MTGGDREGGGGKAVGKVAAHMVALYTVWYDYVRVYKSPAMAAGVTDRLWSMEDVAARLEATEAPAKKRGPYKKAASNA